MSESEDDDPTSDRELSGIGRLNQSEDDDDADVEDWDDLESDDNPPTGGDETTSDDDAEDDPIDPTSTSTIDSDDELPSTRDLPQTNMNLLPEINKAYIKRWRQFRNEYETEHFEEEARKNLHFNNAIVMAALTDQSLDEILDDIIEKESDVIPTP